MPIYEYVCSECGRHLEAIQKVSDQPLEKCRFCGGVLKKIISAPAIQFKGNGWYITDYARKLNSPKEEKGKGLDEPTSDKRAAAKSETEAKKPSAAKD